MSRLRDGEAVAEQEQLQLSRRLIAREPDWALPPRRMSQELWSAIALAEEALVDSEAVSALALVSIARSLESLAAKYDPE